MFDPHLWFIVSLYIISVLAVCIYGLTKSRNKYRNLTKDLQNDFTYHKDINKIHADQNGILNELTARLKSQLEMRESIIKDLKSINVNNDEIIAALKSKVEILESTIEDYEIFTKGTV